MSYIFVYGTLKTGGERNHMLAEDFEYRGEACVRGELYNWANLFPVLRLDHSLMASVEGEVWNLEHGANADKVFAKLDEIEGVPFLFKRVWTDMFMEDEMNEDGEPIWVEAQTYVGASNQMWAAPIIEENYWPIGGL